MLIILPYKKPKEGFEKDLIVTLRSIEANYDVKPELVIVGDRPRLLDPESYTYIKGNLIPGGHFNNVANNALIGAKYAQENGHEKALVINDDFVFMKKMKTVKLYRNKQNLKEYVEYLRSFDMGSLWYQTNIYTRRLLGNEIPSLEIHTPLPIEVDLFVEALSSVNWELRQHPQWRSVYGKFFIEKYPNKKLTVLTDPKIRRNGEYREKDPLFISFSDHESSKTVLNRLLKKFNKPSQWELIKEPHKIAVAVSSTGTRMDSLSKTISAFQKYPPNYFTVNFDFERNGVAYTKNMGIKWFMEETDADYLFLVDDDFRPINDDYLRNYIFASQKHGIPHFTGIYRTNEKTPPVDGLKYGGTPSGCVLFITREAVEKVGYMRNLEFNAFGFEHSEYSRRIANAYPKIYTNKELQFIDIKNSIDCWRGEDFDQSGRLLPINSRYNKSTFKKQDRQLELGEELYEKYKNNSDYVAFDPKVVVNE